MSKAVAAELRAELARQQFSIRGFAAKNKLPLSTLHKNISGNRAIDIEDLQSICGGLDISISEIITRAELKLVSEVGDSVVKLPKVVTEEDVPKLGAVAESDYTQLSEDDHTP